MKVLLVSLLLSLTSLLQAKEFSPKNLDCQFKISTDEKTISLPMIYSESGIIGPAWISGFKNEKAQYRALAFGGMPIKNKLILLYVEIVRDEIYEANGSVNGSSKVYKANLALNNDSRSGFISSEVTQWPEGSSETLAVVCEVQ
nr:hypothetical protein BHI3_03890 [Bacteriovorax sp. HI3]